MSKITDKEKNELLEIIDNAGLYRLKSMEEFSVYLDKCMDGFENNALFTYLCGGTFRKDIVKQIFYSSYCAASGNAITYADSEELNSCAVWIPSGILQTNLTEFFKSGESALLKMGGFPLITRVLSYEISVKGMKNSLTNHNEWYLYNYECTPDYDNNEVFTRMVKPVVSYAWKTGRACYIECSVESRIDALMKMGFHIVDTITIPKTDIKLYGMMV